MALGGALFQGNSKLLSGPLGVVKVGFNGYDLGKTTGDTILTPNQAVKDILYQQDGTMKADTVRTGMMYQLKAVFGEINTGLLEQMMSGFKAPYKNANDDAGILGRSIYESMRDTEASTLKIAAVDANGAPSEFDTDIMWFYEVVPMVDADLINWGADTQRELAVTFDIYWYEFAEGESSTYVGEFGYYGDPTNLDVPAATWADRSGPQLESAATTSATEVQLTFNEECALVGGVTAIDRIYMVVNDDYVQPTVVAIDGGDAKLVNLTVPTIIAGDVLKVCLQPGVLEDTETTPNLNTRIVDYSTTNNVV